MNKEHAYKLISEFYMTEQTHNTNRTKHVIKYLFENDPVMLAKALGLCEESGSQSESVNGKCNPVKQTIYVCNIEQACSAGILIDLMDLVTAVNKGNKSGVKDILVNKFGFTAGESANQVCEYFMNPKFYKDDFTVPGLRDRYNEVLNNYIGFNSIED